MLSMKGETEAYAMNYASGNEFYNELIKLLKPSSSNANDSSSSAKKGENDKLAELIPKNVNDLVYTIEDTTNMPLRKLLVCYWVITFKSLRDDITNKRRMHLEYIRTHKSGHTNNHHQHHTTDIESSNSMNGEMPRPFADKIQNRIDHIPLAMKKLSSKAIKLALAYYCSVSHSEHLRKILISYILHNNNNDLLSTEKIIDLACNLTDSKEEVESLPIATKKVSEEITAYVGALFELSALMRDKSFGKSASNYNRKAYLTACKHYSEKTVPITIRSPYEALIDYYVKRFVANISAVEERTRLLNQFNVDAKNIINHIIKQFEQLPITPKHSNASSVNKKGDGLFNPKQLYYAYIGPQNFFHKLNQTYYVVNNITWWIITYKDCLFDVIGYEITQFEAKPGPESRIHHMLCDKNWQERLDAVPYRAKIDIRQYTGEELNKNHKGGAAYVSWMNADGFSLSKYYAIPTKRGIKRPHSD